VIARSETIAVVTQLNLPPITARSRGTPVATLDVQEVLKGRAKRGKLDVRFEDYPDAASGRFIAFIDKAGVWRFIAEPVAGKTVESGVLTLRGFYDGNAHWVDPGFVTLKQLSRYLKDGALTYSFHGAVWFPQPGKSSWKPGSLTIQGTYDGVSDAAHVRGLEPPAGFPAEPRIRVSSLRRGDSQLSLEYSQSLHRQLEVRGYVEGVDPTGGLAMRFVVTSPDVLTQESLQKYLADLRLGHPYYVFRLHCTPTAGHQRTPDLLLTLEKEIGTIGTLEGWGSAPLDVLMVGFNEASGSSAQALAGVDLPERLASLLSTRDRVLRIAVPIDSKETLILAVDVEKPGDVSNTFHWTFQPELLYRVYSAPVRGRLQRDDGKNLDTIATFSVTLDPVHFAAPFKPDAPEAAHEPRR
jgi:hypothetical protein